MNYWDKLSELHLYSQERRRERYQVIFLWKISQGMVSCFDIEFTHTMGRGEVNHSKGSGKGSTICSEKCKRKVSGGQGG